MKNLTGHWEFIFHKASIITIGTIPFIPAWEYPICSQWFNPHYGEVRLRKSHREPCRTKKYRAYFYWVLGLCVPRGSHFTFTSNFFQHKIIITFGLYEGIRGPYKRASSTYTCITIIYIFHIQGLRNV